jgi:hypothetical protein
MYMLEPEAAEEVPTLILGKPHLLTSVWSRSSTSTSRRDSSSRDITA